MGTILIIVVFVATVWAGVFSFRSTGRRLILPPVTLSVAGVTLAVSTAGNLNPEVLGALDRNRDLLLAGQLWRLMTPLFVQDGGWAGTVFNIATLIAVGAFAESLHHGRALLSVYFLSSFISEVVAYTFLPHQGFAGNSVGNMGVAALVLIASAAVPGFPGRLIAAAGVAAGLTLLVTGNLHGIGFTVGVIAGTAITLTGSNKPPVARSP